MYQFDGKSAIAKALAGQRKEFLTQMHALRKTAKHLCGMKKKVHSKGDTRFDDTFFIFDDRYHGWVRKEFDTVTRSQKNEFFYFWLDGKFCRYWREDSVFGQMSPMQEVYTIMTDKDAPVQEIRVSVSGENIVRIKEEDKEFYRKLTLQRKATLGAFASLEKTKDDDLFL